MVACVLLVVGIAAEATGGQSQWWLGPPYRVEALEITVNGNGRLPDFDSLDQRVLSIIGGRTTVLTRDDDAVNASGLGWFATQRHRSLNLVLPAVRRERSQDGKTRTAARDVPDHRYHAGVVS